MHILSFFLLLCFSFRLLFTYLLLTSLLLPFFSDCFAITNIHLPCIIFHFVGSCIPFAMFHSSVCFPFPVLPYFYSSSLSLCIFSIFSSQHSFFFLFSCYSFRPSISSFFVFLFNSLDINPIKFSAFYLSSRSPSSCSLCLRQGLCQSVISSSLLRDIVTGTDSLYFYTRNEIHSPVLRFVSFSVALTRNFKSMCNKMMDFDIILFSFSPTKPFLLDNIRLLNCTKHEENKSNMVKRMRVIFHKRAKWIPIYVFFSHSIYLTAANEVKN